MKITTTAEAFVAALKASIKPERKTTIPILNHVHLLNNSLTVTDLDLTSIVEFDGTGKADLMFPHRQALDVLTGETGTLVIEKEELKKPKTKDPKLPVEYGPVTFSINGCSYKFDSVSTANFPQTPHLADPALTLDGKAFRTMLDRVRFAISNEESRYTLNGALLDWNSTSVKMVGTDGHRLSVVSSELDYKTKGGSDKTIVSRKALDWLRPNLNGSVSIGIKDGFQTFRTGRCTLIARVLNGQFPNWEAVMLRDIKIKAEIAAPLKLASVLTRVAKCADERSGATVWNFGTKNTVSASSTDRGSAEAPIEVTVDGEIQIGWNSQYILDFLKIVGDIPVSLGMKDNQTASIFSVPGFDYLIMPMRI